MYLEGKLGEEMSLITEADCMSVTNLNHTIRLICHVSSRVVSRADGEVELPMY